MSPLTYLSSLTPFLPAALQLSFDLSPKGFSQTIWQHLPHSSKSGGPFLRALRADLLFETSICMHEATDDINGSAVVSHIWGFT